MQQTRPEAERFEQAEWSPVLEQKLVTVMRAIETAALNAECRGGPTEQESTTMKGGEMRLSELLTTLKRSGKDPEEVIYQCARKAIGVLSKEHPLVVKCLRIMGISKPKTKIEKVKLKTRGSAMEALNRRGKK